MLRGLKLAHVGGLVMFLGSILTFIVISTLIEGASLENIAFGRKIISAGTNVLTLPGMWVLAITGVLMGYKRYGLKQRFFQLKLLLIMLVIINGYFFVVPLVTAATEIAVRSLAQGQLLPEYKTAYMRESIFGTVNILIIVAAAVIGVWKVGATSTQD
ncbi:MAG: hypothetical protein A2W27_00070 [Deltaproteobacteria bacterium RBG_16_44_11]|nr:MAG: hypothetical protein A2W27_00070 [Deltaproteobacteria bacterium RBG_16_44_11]